ncbi:MAG: TIGR01777 family protein [Elusimicrobia bacterium]|nr:TIGR01777 family protein [Elusimicrobiota bacterium]
MASSVAQRVALSGASGLIGTALAASFKADGHEMVPLVRRKDAPGVFWDPATGEVGPGLEGVDAVVHLAGENIAAGRWTPARKAAIRDSRVRGTAAVAGALAGLKRKPRVLVCASAVGYYGDCDDALDETAGPGGDFLAQVCRAWEEAAEPAARAGIRVVNARLGVVLSPDGGALAKMLTPFKLGLGGPVGDGQQWMSWVALGDVVGALRHCAAERSLKGPVNVTAPGAVTSAKFAATLGRVLRRPAALPLPAFMVRVLFGEMGEALLLAGQRVLPARLKKAGYTFKHPELEGALRHLLGR